MGCNACSCQNRGVLYACHILVVASLCLCSEYKVLLLRIKRGQQLGFKPDGDKVVPCGLGFKDCRANGPIFSYATVYLLVSND